MRKRIRLLYVVVLAFVITAGGMITMNRLNEDITVLQNTERETRLEKVAVDTVNSDYRRELALKDTENYLREKAREGNKFLEEGEIRFVVVNPEVLYDAEDAQEAPEVIVEEEANEG